MSVPTRIVRQNWIPGYAGKYYATDQGEIFRKGKRTDRHLKGYRKGNLWCVKLTINGLTKECQFGRVVFESLKCPIPHEHVIQHRNNQVNDNRLINLKLTTMSIRGKSTGPKSRSKPVELLDDSGQVIDSWSSARKAAKDLFCSYQTVTDICNKKVKKKIVNVRWQRKEKIWGD